MSTGSSIRAKDDLGRPISRPSVFATIGVLLKALQLSVYKVFIFYVLIQSILRTWFYVALAGRNTVVPQSPMIGLAE